jgi:hypothetical protein
MHKWLRIQGRIYHRDGCPICVSCGFSYDPMKDPEGWRKPCPEDKETEAAERQADQARRIYSRFSKEAGE